MEDSNWNWDYRVPTPAILPEPHAASDPTKCVPTSPVSKESEVFSETCYHCPENVKLEVGYLNGRTYHVNRLSRVAVIRRKSGGYDVNYTNMVCKTDSAEGVTSHITGSQRTTTNTGDVAYIKLTQHLSDGVVEERTIRFGKG